MEIEETVVPPSYKESGPAPAAPLPPPPQGGSVWTSLQPIFFNPSLKLTALRFVLLCSFITTVLGSTWFEWLFDFQEKTAILYVVVLAFTFVHHVVSAFKLAFFIRLLDLLLIIAEIVLLIFHSTFFKFNRWSPKSIIAVVVAIWSLVVCLVFLTLCRIVAIIRKKGKNLLKPFDLLEDSQRLKGLPVKTSPAAYSILLGRGIWKNRFPGESTVVRLVRGIMGGIFLLIMIVYGIVNIAVYPVQETALTPVKEYRVLGTPFDFPLEPSRWNIAFMRPLLSYLDDSPYDPSVFRNAVELLPLWDSSNDDTPECVNDPDPVIRWINDVKYEVIFTSCPIRQNTTDLLRVQYMLPDLLVSVNFTRLLPPQAMTASANLWSTAVQVMPGFTKQDEYVLRTTTPITMLPNTNNLAELEMEVRQIFKHPALSGLGLFESTNSFITARVKTVLPDPLLATPSTLVVAAQGFSTLRIFAPDAISDIKIVEDYREKAVLDGFAVIGGLWTFLCAIFAIFFGIGMTRIVFDTKPLAVFGLAQQFERETIVQEYFKAYPRIRSEIELPPNERGLLNLLRDHLVDVELFQRYLDENEGAKKESLEKAERAEEEEADVDPATLDPTLRYRM